MPNLTDSGTSTLFDDHGWLGQEDGKAFCFKTSVGSGRVVESARDIPEEYRSHTFTDEARDFRYYEITAQTLSGQFEHRFLILQNAETGELAIQPLFLVNQDILDGLPRNIHALLASPRAMFPGWLRMRMLVAGCSAGDGALDGGEPWSVTALQEALTIYARKAKASMILLKDFPSLHREALQPLSNDGYCRVPSMPACALDFDFDSFEQFVAERLGQSFRESLRRKLRKLNKHPPIQMEVLVDATEVAEEITTLYQQTFERSKMRFERLTTDFMVRVGREMPDKARFFIWRFKDKIAAFSLCLVHDGTLHHLNVGFDYSVALDLHLYYVVLRDLIQWSLDNGLTRYVTGQLNYDPKLHFRMKLVPLDLYARHTSPLLNPLFKLALPFLQPVRHDPTIQKFPNAGEL